MTPRLNHTPIACHLENEMSDDSNTPEGTETEAAKGGKVKTEIETVTMDDGRVVEFAGKKRLVKESFYKDGFLQVRMDWRNGETRLFKTADKDLILKAAGHGLEQKLGDETSGVKDLEDCIEVVDQLMQRLEKGVSGWLQIREGGGTGVAGASVLARALQRATEQDIKVVREYLATMDAKTKTALRADPSVAPHIKAIEEERAARAAERGKASKGTVDTASVLAGLKAAVAKPAAEVAQPA